MKQRIPIEDVKRSLTTKAISAFHGRYERKGKRKTYTCTPCRVLLGDSDTAVLLRSSLPKSQVRKSGSPGTGFGP